MMQIAIIAVVTRHLFMPVLHLWAFCFLITEGGAQGRIRMQCSDPDELTDCAGAAAPEPVSSSEVGIAPLVLSFLVLRKRPPSPLALLIAC